MKKSIVVAVVLLMKNTFGLEPSEMVRLYRAALTNEAASREYLELVHHHRDLLADAQSRMNGLELLQMTGLLDVVSSTSTNLVIKFKNPGFHVTHNGTVRGSIEYMENDEPLILTPDQGARIGEYHISVQFTPVSLKKKRHGFQIINQFDAHSFRKGLTSYTGYFALGDTLTPATEDDVITIMKNGEWKTVKEYYASIEREDRLQELQVKYIDRRREANELLQGEELTNRLAVIEHETQLEKEQIEAGEQAEVCPPSRCLWLYALIPPCLLAVLWLVKRKRKRETKN